MASDKRDLALTPPLGFRTWNLFGPNVNQSLLESIMDGITRRRRLDHTGVLSSLCDLGYCDVGLDDNWQHCDSPQAAPGMRYHDINGKPLINTSRFPDLKAMTAYAHSRGLTAGWYHNNCICSDHCRNETECEMQIGEDVRAILQYDFDSVKLDGCGGEMNLSLFDQYFRQYSPNKRILVENCHWGRDAPTPEQRGKLCPYSFYRTSGDVRPNYESVMHNLQTVEKFHAHNLSTPGCWAYPDMLQVGVRQDYTGAHGLNEAETRSHFGAWAIVSSPLILSHDVNNDTLMDEIWPLISNREVIAINQAYAGDSGGVYHVSNQTVQLPDIAGWQAYPGTPNAPKTAPVVVPSHQFLSKKLGDGRVAVLLMNSANETTELVVSFKNVPDIECRDRCQVRDIWQHEIVGVFSESWSVSVGPHDAAFIVLETVEQATTPSHFLATLMAIAVSTIIFLTVKTTRRRKWWFYNHVGAIDNNRTVEMEELKLPEMS